MALQILPGTPVAHPEVEERRSMNLFPAFLHPFAPVMNLTIRSNIRRPSWDNHHPNRCRVPVELHHGNSLGTGKPLIYCASNNSYTKAVLGFIVFFEQGITVIYCAYINIIMHIY